MKTTTYTILLSRYPEVGEVMEEKVICGVSELRTRAMYHHIRNNEDAIWQTMGVMDETTCEMVEYKRGF